MEVKLGRYRHFKGHEYDVLGVATNTETMEPVVIYRECYGEGALWVRPLRMWNEQVNRDGYSGPRFTYMGGSKLDKN